MTKIRKKLNIVMTVFLIFTGLAPFGCMEPVQAKAEEKTVVVGFFDDDDPNFIDGFSDDARKSGYAYEYIMEVAKITGWHYEYVYGSWNEIYALLQEGKVDMVPGLAYLDSRRKDILYADYNQPMIKKQYYVFAYINSKMDPREPESMENMKVAATANSVQLDLLKRYAIRNKLQVTYLEYATEGDCKKAVEKGEADAYVASTTHDNTGFMSYYYIGDANCYAAFAKGRDALRNEMYKALEQIYTDIPYYNYKLEEKYFRRYYTGSALSAEDKRILRNRGSIKIGVTKDDLPLSAVDKDDNVIGLAGVLIQNLEKFLQTPVEVYKYDSVAALEKDLANGVVDIGFPVFYDLWYAEKNNYILTIPVISEHVLLVFKDDFSEDKKKTVAVGDSTVSQRYLVDRYYPQAEIHKYSTRKEYLEAIQKGEVGFTLGSNSVISRFIECNPEYKDLKTALLPTEIEFTFAVTPKSAELVAILNKAIRNIEPGNITEAMIKYSVVEKKATLGNYVKENRLSVITTLLVLVAIVLTLAVVIRDQLHTHKKTIASQKIRLGETQASLEEALKNEIKAKTDLARALADQNVIYSELLRMESGGVVAVDWDTRKLITANESALKILGLKNEAEAQQYDADILMQHIIEEVREEKRKELYEGLDKCNAATFEAPIEIDGEIKYFFVQAVLRDLSGGQKVCLGSITDITDAKELELELQTASRIDALSSVYNRGWGEKMVTDAMNSGHGGMFCLLDINKFKTINDTLGHQNGDKAIKIVASALKESFREDDIILRLGGDEFAVYALGVRSREEGAAIINRFFGRLNKNRIGDTRERQINVALGACICSGNDKMTFDDVYRMADSQMYKCKEKQESSFIFI